MGFYIEELPTELNGITMKEAVYWADIYLQDNPCDRMWDAIRALRDFYETVTSEAIEMADRKTEPTISKMEQVDKDINVRSKDEPKTSKIIEAYSRGFEDGAEAVKAMPQTERSGE